MQFLEMEIGAQSYNFNRFNLQSSRKENEEEYMNTEGRLYGVGIAE